MYLFKLKIILSCTNRKLFLETVLRYQFLKYEFKKFFYVKKNVFIKKKKKKEI